MINLYSKPNCPYCVLAKNWLDKNGFDYTVIDIAEDPKAADFLVDSGYRTVPQIFWNDRLLVPGGSDGLHAMTPVSLATKIATMIQKSG